MLSLYNNAMEGHAQIHISPEDNVISLHPSLLLLSVVVHHNLSQVARVRVVIHPNSLQFIHLQFAQGDILKIQGKVRSSSIPFSV